MITFFGVPLLNGGKQWKATCRYIKAKSLGRAERRKTMSINTKWTPHGEFGHATKTFVAACDYCGAELEQCETYSEAILSTREHGWRNELRSDGSWANICPDCVEQYFSV